MVLHEFLDVWVRFPAVKGHLTASIVLDSSFSNDVLQPSKTNLISANVHKLVGEQIFHLLVELGQEIVSETHRATQYVVKIRNVVTSAVAGNNFKQHAGRSGTDVALIVGLRGPVVPSGLPSV